LQPGNNVKRTDKPWVLANGFLDFFKLQRQSGLGQ
jgi:hypothetical protein